MKPKTSSQPRRKLSFAVDRDEVDISTDWVQAVMAPRPPEPHEAGGHFFGSPANNATDERSTTVAQNAAAQDSSTVDNNTGLALAVPVVANSTASFDGASVVNNAPVVNNATRCNNATVVENSSVVDSSTVAVAATVAETDAVDNTAIPSEPLNRFPPASETPNRRRSPRLRPIRRVTDGLTPGQYAVYNLMRENGEAAEQGTRLYRGGYADLCLLTGLSKRGIQNVIAELQLKKVIALHQAPGYRRTETSVYRMSTPEKVVESWISLGLRYSVGKSKTLSNGSTVALLAAG